MFEENAVVRLRLGILFVIVFKELRLDGIVNGATKGIVSGEISQKMFLYRKRIRRITDEK